MKKSVSFSIWALLLSWPFAIYAFSSDDELSLETELAMLRSQFGRLQFDLESSRGEVAGYRSKLARRDMEVSDMEACFQDLLVELDECAARVEYFGESHKRSRPALLAYKKISQIVKESEQ